MMWRILVFIWLSSALDAGDRDSSKSRVSCGILSISSGLRVVGSLSLDHNG